MTIRKKTLLIIAVILTGLIVSFLATSLTILRGGFLKVEEIEITRDANLFLSTMGNEIHVLNSTARDWSSWDDSYEFIRKPSRTYIESNLMPTTYGHLRVNLIMYAALDGSVVFGMSYNPDTEEETSLPPEIVGIFSRDGLLFTDPDATESVKGIVLLPEGPMIVSANPILKSDEKGPGRGTLIMGRRLDTTEIQRLARLTHLPITTYALSSGDVPHDLQDIVPLVTGEKPIVIRPASSEYIECFTTIKDLHGASVLLVRISEPRKIYNQGRVTITYVIISLIVAALAFGFTILMMLEKSIISRLARISERVQGIGSSKNLSHRIELPGDDELGMLAREINGMLEKIEATDKIVRDSEERYRAFITQSTEGIWRAELERPLSIREPEDVQVRYLFESAAVAECNDAMARMYGYENSGGIVGRPLSTIFRPGEPDHVEFARRFISSGYQVQNAETRIADGDGPTRFFLNNVMGIIEGGFLVRLWGIQQDITALKQVEDEIKRSLREKEALLREIHHRVKNNMQVISSLLSLQSRHITDEKSLELFKDSQNRVRSMALIHEKLYQSKDLAGIDIGQYIQGLAQQLFRLYEMDPGRIAFRLDAHDITFQIDTAIPCGLIVNELISNALKHAFPDGKKGEISVSIHSRNDDLYALTVKDSGIGIPESLDITRTDTLGLSLVKSLADQLRGTLEVGREGGTAITITFKKPR